MSARDRLRSLTTRAKAAGGCNPADALTVIERFLQTAKQPALLEPGEEFLALEKDHYALDLRASRLTLQAWDRHRNFVRRVVDIHS
ncbi:MAG: hypothetical protein EXQ52_13435 [Bryobacterales bacterium]|nr:hypothetical protein [Bryobacterales bacterium]